MFSQILTLALSLGQIADQPIAVPPGTYAHVGPTPPPHGYPAIRSVSISTTEIRAGTPIHGSVETSPNVGYVEARINYKDVPMRHDGPGRFSLTYTVPWWLPPWLRHAYDLQIIARSVDGVETSKLIPVHVH